jgi:iron complex outermembrane receptor protein
MGSQVDREREKTTDAGAEPHLGAERPDHAHPLRLLPEGTGRSSARAFYPAVGTLLNNPNGQIPRDLYLGDPNAEVFERDFYTLGYEFEHEFNETWTVRQNLRYGRSDQNMFLVLVNPVFAYQPDGHTLNRASAISDDWVSSFNVDTQAEARFDTGALDHTLLIGLDYLKASSSTNFGNGLVGIPPFDLLNPTYGEVDIPVPDIQRSGLQKQQQLGLYTQDQIRYDNWVGTFGLRYDFSDIESTNRLTGTTVSNDDQRLTWRAGLTYLFDNGLAPYASYSTSFLPTLGTDQAGNPFKAQTAEQYEIGLKYEPPVGRGIITVSLFDMTLENALTPDPTNALFNLQTGEQRVRGVEIEGKYELTPELDLLAAYAYSNSEILKSNRASELGREMLRLPEHQGSVWVNYRPSAFEGLTLNAGVRAMSSYQTDSTYLPELRIPGRALVDIGAEYDFGAIDKDFSGTRLRVNVTNLFDKEYVSHCLNTTGGSCNYGAGRAITASLKYSW